MKKDDIKRIDINSKTLKELMEESKGLKLVRVKNTGKKLKKVLFNLFRDEVKRNLINYDNSIEEISKELEKESNWRMVDRKTLVPMDMISEEIGKCSVVREQFEFIPGVTEDEDSYRIETRFCRTNNFRLKELAKYLASQDRLVEYSIRSNLKDVKDYQLAKDLSIYLGFIDSKEEKKEITSKHL